MKTPKWTAIACILLTLICSTCALSANSDKEKSKSKDNPKLQLVLIHAHSCALKHADPSVLALANALGWVIDPHAPNLCCGYYAEPSLSLPTDVFSSPEATRITTDKSSIFVEGEHSQVSGHVLVQQQNRRITANVVDIYREPKSGDVTHLDLKGNISIREPGKLLLGEKAHLNLKNKTGHITNAHYRISLTDDANPVLGVRELYGINGWGKASRIDMINPKVFSLSDASYSNCPITNNSWKIMARKITLNKKTGHGQARNATFRIHDIPVLYTPFVDFLIDDRRDSGFLFPAISNNNNSGFDITLPYYLNLAPNYDATLFPRYMSKRGTMLGAEFRYLDHISYVKLRGAYLPDDRAFADFIRDSGITSVSSNNRSSFAIVDHSQLTEHWSADVNYSTVSDDYYFEDLHNHLLDATTNQLLQMGRLTYRDEHFHFLAQLQRYQTLHPITIAPIADVYSRLPEVYLDIDFPEQHYFGQTFHEQVGNIHWHLHSNYNHFIWPVDTPPTKTNGLRFVFKPSVSFPLVDDGAYITPTLAWHWRDYQLNNGLVDEAQVSLPITSVDAGLFFERDFVGPSHHPYVQTLEPRIYYLYVPFEDQSLLPTFDTALAAFNVDQLFRDNRFTGDDRFGDANQLSLALSSKLLDDATGAELLRADIGEIVYFQNRRVQLCTGLGCVDPENTVAFVSSTANTSPLVGKLDIHPFHDWHATLGVTWEHQLNRVNYSYINFQYVPLVNHIINLNYSFVRNGDVIATDPNLSDGNLRQLSVSEVWPITEHWRTVGSLRYNIARQYAQTYFAGAEYNSCCWAIRFLAGRTFTLLDPSNRPQYDTVFYLQILLKGMSTFGSNNLQKILVDNIPGYHDDFE